MRRPQQALLPQAFLRSRTEEVVRCWVTEVLDADVVQIEREDGSTEQVPRSGLYARQPDVQRIIRTRRAYLNALQTAIKWRPSLKQNTRDGLSSKEGHRG